MTVSLNNDCTEYTLYSDYLTPTNIVNMDSIVLRSRKNCSSTAITADLIEYIESTENKIYANTVEENFGGLEKFCDGVYQFELEMVYTIGDITTTIIETYCLFVDCELSCKIVEAYFNNPEGSKKIMYEYQALKYGNDCDSCNCSTMCGMYEDLLYQLKIGGYDTSCGCD